MEKRREKEKSAFVENSFRTVDILFIASLATTEIRNVCS